MTMHWEESELPEDCYYRRLTPQVGANGPRDSDLLPIERVRAQIEKAVSSNRVVVVQAAPGTGKTMKIPLFMVELLNPDAWKRKWPILVVQQSCFAAERVVQGLVEFFNYPREEIHLRTGTHDKQSFTRGTTTISVIAYGILWRWLTEHGVEGDDSAAGHAGPIQRYVGVFLDEFADLSPQKEEASRLLGAL
jgi:hypothetical protein